MHGKKLLGGHYILWNQLFLNNAYTFAIINPKLKNPFVNYKETSGIFGPYMTYMTSEKGWNSAEEEFLTLTPLFLTGCAKQRIRISLHYGTYCYDYI